MKYEINYSEVQMDGMKYFVPKYAEHRPAAQTIMRGFYYEEHTHIFMRHVLNETKKSAIHAGAFFGDMIPNFSRNCLDMLYVFEPVLENYIMAKKSVENNNLENVVLFNMALSDKTGSAKMKTIQDNGLHMGGWSHITKEDKGTQIVNTIRVDDLDLKEISVFHFDVEGHNIEVLKGALRKISIDEPIILMEDGESKADGLMELMGYTLMRKTPLINFWSTDKYKEICNNALNFCK